MRAVATRVVKRQSRMAQPFARTGRLARTFQQVKPASARALQDDLRLSSKAQAEVLKILEQVAKQK